MAYTPPIDEKELVAQLHDPKMASQAFDTLLKTYSQPVYWQIRKMVANHDDANDLVQNVFIKAWKNLHNFRGDAKLSTWLLRLPSTNRSTLLIRRSSVFNLERMPTNRFFSIILKPIPTLMETL